ncbi:hypothetical protein CCR94_08730 [Rhodoblastus sphagnicola]|uniref:Uncharacterized protein n=1 Tax=Rhodoblastus sphagnicola TaxID=333368 RepID=A0A2S6N9U3_9HYPH|nr:hypothetical protein [Rhodoblastus sphagnicola]MBB4198746.1 hypothetical protein [Rhodoblastus sphagnicola]PPQ31386.1 hypothetical protein CCR94_08730 [Rhodoblastus sphagnicola]
MKSFVALGQSNSILHAGFLNKIKERKAARFLRSALVGASPSVIGPYYMDDGFFDGADYCLIDTCVVDLTVQKNNSTDLCQVAQWIEWIGHKCRMNNCQPIFVLIPVQVHLDHPVMSIYMSVINANRYLYIDVRDLIVSEIAGDEKRISSLFVDPAHIGPSLVDGLASVICSFFQLENDTVNLNRTITYCYRDFSVVNLADRFPQFECVKYKNSLITFSGIRISKGAEIQLDVGRVLKVHAIYLNAAKSRSKIRISGDVTLVKNLNLRPYMKTEFEARIVPIRTTVQDRDGRLSITLAENDELCDEMTMQEYSEFDGEQCLELEGILVECGLHVDEYRTFVPSGQWNILTLS